MYILDTNILIYILANRQDIREALMCLNMDKFAMSVISRFELQIGMHKQDISAVYLEAHLSKIEQIPLDENMIDRAIDCYQIFGNRKSMFKDALIAATAIEKGYVLVTADKDFLKIADLKMHFIEI